MRVIDSFDGLYSFLSNFYPVDIYEKLPSGENIIYPSVEHAYQAAKSLDVNVRRKAAQEETPGRAKQAGGPKGYIELRDDWDMVKDSIMYKYLKQKFGYPYLANMLSSTGDALLIEGNRWGDDYWGKCTFDGLNKLGVMLMEIRNHLQTQV